MAKDVAIVLNSGSVNSAVVTALASQRYRPVMLHVTRGPVEPPDSGEEHAPRARIAFDQQVAHFKPFREHLLAIPLVTATRSAQGRSHAGVPAELRSQAAPQAPRAGLELLPIVAAAAQLAREYEATSLYLGLRVGGGVDELAQATEYVQIWTELLQLPCGLAELEIQAPLLELEPWQVVDLGFQVNAPLDRTWSCQNPGGGDACWACPGCRQREAAFERAAKPDPLRSIKR